MSRFGTLATQAVAHAGMGDLDPRLMVYVLGIWVLGFRGSLTSTFRLRGFTYRLRNLWAFWLGNIRCAYNLNAELLEIWNFAVAPTEENLHHPL